MRTFERLGAWGLSAIALSACQSEPKASITPVPVAIAAPRSDVIARSDNAPIVTARSGDTAANLAAHYLGDAALRARVRPLSDPSGRTQVFKTGEPVAIFLHPLDPGGTLGAAAERVPILCYHRFTARERSTSRMEVSAATFEEQLRFLRAQGYSPVPLKDLVSFLSGRSELPPKPVVITIDDGYRSAYTVAFPLLAKYKVPATVFIYTDFVGAGEALTWSQLSEMASSKLIDVESHSRTHGDLTKRPRGEGEAAYQRRMKSELDTPRRLLEEKTAQAVRFFAFPYGAASPALLSDLRKDDWQLGLTVIRGGNPSWAEPLLLRREMIFGSDTLDGFVRRLDHATQAPNSP